MKKSDLMSLINKLTLEEKISLCSGADFWHTVGIERLGIPSIMLSDGPHGLRKQNEKADHLGINNSIKAICFPTSSAIACSFDMDLIKKIGKNLGTHARNEKLAVILGPGVNMKRSPLCGRNFEYYSEDPYLSGKLAGAFINGVQSMNVGTSLKHFACNNQETRRMFVSSNVSQKALFDIYLKPFEIAIKDGKPWTVMSAYNKINGVPASSNKWLLNDVLRKKFGFKGLIVSDWSAISNRVEAAKATGDLDMPGKNHYNDMALLDAVNNHKLNVKVVDKMVYNILNLVYKVSGNLPLPYSLEEGHGLARLAAIKSHVLLKNNEQFFPIKENEKVLVIGEFAKIPRYQGGGSSHVNPYKVDAFMDFASSDTRFTYEKCFSATSNEIDSDSLNKVLSTISNYDKVIVFAGLPETYESEGYDRTNLELPKVQTDIISNISKLSNNIGIILQIGAPVTMPFVDDVKGILNSYLGGEGVGYAQYQLLVGNESPSGKLAETFPIKLADNPSYLSFPGDDCDVDYSEGVYVGYRYYSKKNIPVLFPFGHGLTYSNCSYSNLFVDKKELNKGNILNVSVDIHNNGDKKANFVTQVYIASKNDPSNPPIELKRFTNTCLKSGASKKLEFALTSSDFEHYENEQKKACLKLGLYDVCIASSANEILLKSTIKVNAPYKPHFRITLDTLISDVLYHPITSEIMKNTISTLMGESQKDESLGNSEVLQELMLGLPIRCAYSMIGDEKIEMVNQLIDYCNKLLEAADK